jgi:hypothetical protein
MTGKPDEVLGILEPYSGLVSIWTRDGSGFHQGDKVPAVGRAQTYAIVLDAPVGSPRRFLWVQAGKITNLMAHQPIEGRSVFDARGRYLGSGGDVLDDPSPLTAAIPSLVELAFPTRVHDPATHGHGATLIHSFRLRPDFTVSVELPVNLSEKEAERLADFMLCLPFGQQMVPSARDHR